MRTENKVIPQPPQVRPPGPSHAGFAANDPIMTPDTIASIRERQYPKTMYCDGEEPLNVLTAEVELTLGSGWRETPEDPNRSPDPLTVPETREDYYKLNQANLLAVIAQTTDEATLRTMLVSEVANPRRPNGRPVVLEALKAQLTPTEPAQAKAETKTVAPDVFTGASAVVVDESELEPIAPPPARAAATRGRRPK